MPSELKITFFFFNATATTEIYTLSLHDALPISRARPPRHARTRGQTARCTARRDRHRCRPPSESVPIARSEEHTSELQSQSNLVCRLLLEKKKQKKCRRSGITRTLSAVLRPYPG